MLEWLEISPELTVVATATGAFPHSTRALGSDPFQSPMEGKGTAETTHWLLEGAIAAAGRELRGASTVSASPRAPGVSAAYWAYRLAGYFQTTDATRRLLPIIARRFEEAERHPLATWAEQKINEEAGHEQLALRDLSELGYRGRALACAHAPPRAAAWVALFEQLAAAPDPVGCVGYAHALERLALLRGAAEVSEIEQCLPRGVNATRCLRVHSALGSDARHVRSNVTTTAGLCADERRAIARACYLTARIYFDPTLDDDFHSAQLEAKVLVFREHSRLSRRLSDDNPTPYSN